METEPDHYKRGWSRLEWTAPLAVLAIGGLALGAERAGLVSAPAAIVATAVSVAALVWLLGRAARDALTESEAERRKLEAKANQVVDRDVVTGVFTHHRLKEELRRQLAFAQRYGSQMALLAVQLDGFEEIRRAHGEATADELLITTAEVLDDELRITDVVTRRVPHGFFVLLPKTDEQSARIVAAKLVRRMRAIARARSDGDSIALRASIGVALSDPNGFDDAERLVARADAALAAARDGGGDRLALHDASL
jgi:diguanylate cyclase (GGDEF)-like protein